MNQSQAAPAERTTDPGTPLNAVFRRLADRPVTAPRPLPRQAEAPSPAPIAAPARPVMAPRPPRIEPAVPAAVALAPSAAPIPPQAEAPRPRFSLAAALLARASSAISRPSAPEARDGPTIPVPPVAPEPAAAPPIVAAPPAVPVAMTPGEAERPPEPALPEPIIAEPLLPFAEIALEEPAPAPSATPPLPGTAPAEIFEETRSAGAPAVEAPAIRAVASTPLARAAAIMPPGDWPVPAWLVAPVLKLAIPDSPFGRGSAGIALPIPIEEPIAPEPVEPVHEATPTLATPVVDAVAPTPVIEPAEILAPEAVAEPHESVVPAPVRRVSAEAMEAQPSAEPAAAPPQELPRDREEARPAAREPRAEPRPASPGPAAAQVEPAPAAAPVADGAASVGVATADAPPVVVEPQGSGGELVEPSEPARTDNRPTMRNRRLYRRVGFDAAIEINGIAAKLVDLSMGGFAASNAPEIAPHTVVPVSLRWSIDGVDISTRMRARTIHGDGARSGGRFIDLTASQTAFLRYAVTWRNQAVGALGTTTLLDAITRTPSRPPIDFPAIEPPAPKTPWWSRWFGRLLGPRRGEAE